MAGTPSDGLNISTQGTLYFNSSAQVQSIPTGATNDVYTSTGAGTPPVWMPVSGGSGITTIDGDSGSITGTTVTVEAGVSTQNCGATVKFTNTGTTSTLNVTSASPSFSTIIGLDGGNGTISGNSNTGIGYKNFPVLTTGHNNVSIGGSCFFQLTQGANNTALGDAALSNTTTGSNNIAIGSSAGAGLNGPENSNILINAAGITSTSNALIIGSGTGTSLGELSTVYISGINGNTSASPAIVTTNTSTDQLGTMPYILNGTFTPTLDGSTPGTTTYAANGQKGYYTRIGNMIFAQGYISITAATGTGTVILGGFPVAANGQTNGNSIGSIFWQGNASWTFPTGCTSLSIQLPPGSVGADVCASGSGVASNFMAMANAALIVEYSIVYTV